MRIPAECCGICGYRPSLGRYSTKHIVPLDPDNDTPGILGATTKDIALLDSVLSDSKNTYRPASLGKINVCVPYDWIGDTKELGERNLKALDRAIEVFQRQGVIVWTNTKMKQIQKSSIQLLKVDR